MPDIKPFNPQVIKNLQDMFDDPELGKALVEVLAQKNPRFRGIVRVHGLADGDVAVAIELDGNVPSIRILSDGEPSVKLSRDGSAWLGGDGLTGRLLLFDNSQSMGAAANASVQVTGSGRLALGGAGQSGELRLLDAEGRLRCRMLGQNGDMWIGGNGADGTIAVFPAESDRSHAREASILIDGREGDILMRNADFAEDFDIAEADVTPGTVMVLDDVGRLCRSRDAYDRRVAGVISGAGAYKPGIVLDRHRERDGRLPLAMVGKVYCQVDATAAPIRVGDLMTTSRTPGHAMAAADPVRAFGAVIGKALAPLEDGKGLIPMLVALQ